MSLAVANQYAKALLEVVSAPTSGLGAEDALAQLDTFSAAMTDSHDLRTVLDSPAVAFDQKRKVVQSIGDLAGMHPLVRNFLSVVIHKRRLGLLPEIRERFRALLDESLGIARAHVVAAQPISEPARASLESELARLTGKTVRGNYTVDPALVGGITVNVGSKMYDGSVRGQLAALRRRLTSEV